MKSLLVLLYAASLTAVSAWTLPGRTPVVITPSSPENRINRRDALQKASILASSFIFMGNPEMAGAAETSATAEVTDRIYVNVKGLPGSEGPQRIVIGLFGKEAPSSVTKLKALVSTEGLPAPCRPKAERALIKEQLEANKVYNSCMDGEEQGVSLQYSQIWRIVRDERIDMGAVSGKFVSRDYPDWKETVESSLKHDSPGVVSVRRGNEAGFGFTIGFPQTGGSYMDEEYIIVGRVVEGLDVIEALNNVPVVQSSSLNYMALTGGTTTKNAPTRACRYGGPMYCNENKPLVKLSITQAGLV
jgi:cyclophilin family peptidyl-prolyl cis-trans isomerase